MSMELAYYEELTDIIEVCYVDEIKFVLFKYNLVDNRRGVKVDNFGITSVDFSHLLNNNNPTDEPFILASQAQQLMYVEDPIDPEWEVAIKMTSRDTFEVHMRVKRCGDPDEEMEYESEAHISNDSEEGFDDTSNSMDDDGVGKMRDDESDDDWLHLFCFNDFFLVNSSFFTPNKDDPEKLLIPPSDNRVDPEQWPDLVNYLERKDVQISKWFINARVRLRKPMVDYMYKEESYDQEDKSAYNNLSSSDGNEKDLAPIATNSNPDFYNEIEGSM
uniref:DUF4216 domain-containing protein n=1 Tax=Tanacetum cinerariifolium TaxID=118510 RepID=A0A699I1X7_TANCI|nr:hypothetical protein [Tanacetum cinerariifolium]